MGLATRIGSGSSLLLARLGLRAGGRVLGRFGNKLTIVGGRDPDPDLVAELRPELIGIPPLVTEAAEWLAGRGHPVDVVTALPNYPERRIFPATAAVSGGARPRTACGFNRSWLRVRPDETVRDKALYEASFAAVSAPLALARIRRADVLVCVVPTLLTAGLGALVGARDRNAVRPLGPGSRARRRPLGRRVCEGANRRAVEAMRRVERLRPPLGRPHRQLQQRLRTVAGRARSRRRGGSRPCRTGST